MPLTRTRLAAPVLALLLLLVPLALAGCGDDEPSEEEAVNQLCGDLERFAATLGDVAGSLSINSSVDDIRAARDEAQAAFDEVRESARDVAGIRLDELAQAWDEFTAAIDSISESGSISEALTTLRDASEQLSTAFADAFRGLDCE